MSVFWLITGASRGLGAALARAAVARGDRVLGIARSPAAAGESLCLDLADLDALAAAVGARLAQAQRGEPAPQRWVLVNNAAVLGPIGSGWQAGDVEQVLRVNLGAPVVLARCFLDCLAGHPAPRLVLNVSSGAATRVIAGWSLYATSKAGLEHFGRCLAAEHRLDPRVAVVSLSPGVIDTDMQARIRATGPQDFPDHARFVALHEQGALADPDTVAASILRGVDRGLRWEGASCRLEEFAGP